MEKFHVCPVSFPTVLQTFVGDDRKSGADSVDRTNRSGVVVSEVFFLSNIIWIFLNLYGFSPGNLPIAPPIIAKFQCVEVEGRYLCLTIPDLVPEILQLSLSPN